MQAKSRAQLAAEYGICTRTFRRWLKKHQFQLSKGLITPKEQELIYAVFGYPRSVTNLSASGPDQGSTP